MPQPAELADLAAVYSVQPRTCYVKGDATLLYLAETANSCFYICSDNSEIFLIKGVDPQCGEGGECPPVQVSE